MCLMVNFTEKERYDLTDLTALIGILRDPVAGCPWDREQTHASIRQNMIEEAYEAAEAIDREDSDLLCEELGDVLLQVLLHAEIERQAGGFDLGAIADRLCRKLILRHPHIFGTVKVDDSRQVLGNWEEIKRREKNQKTGSDAIDDVPHAMPALMRSQKVQKRAAHAGFEYPDIAGALSDLESEVAELKDAVAGRGDSAEEIGDVLFAAVNVARHAGADAELCALRSCEKFIGRFRAVEQQASDRDIRLKDASPQTLDALWREAKATFDAQKPVNNA